MDGYFSLAFDGQIDGLTKSQAEGLRLILNEYLPAVIDSPAVFVHTVILNDDGDELEDGHGTEEEA